VLAKSLDAYSPDSSGSLLSVEQNLWVKKEIEARLQDCGLKQHVSVIHSPVSRRGEYQIDPDQLRRHLGSDKADWVVIDGPAGPDGCRAPTLPFLAQFCRPGARWFLDDAFRDGELGILNEWTGLTGIVVGLNPNVSIADQDRSGILLVLKRVNESHLRVASIRSPEASPQFLFLPKGFARWIAVSRLSPGYGI
jgi:hypothetical protein